MPDNKLARVRASVVARLSRHLRLSDSDRELVLKRRGEHNRLGFAYQIAFVRITGRFPAQKPFEIDWDLLRFAAAELGADPDAIEVYAGRQQTVSEHREQIREHLRLRRFGDAERRWIERILFEEAGRLDQRFALLAKARQVLLQEHILMPADSKLERMVGEQRARAREAVFERMMGMINPCMRERIDVLLSVIEGGSSELQSLKRPPGFSSPASLVVLTDKLERIRATGILELDLSWINNNFRKALARRASHHKATRLREFAPAHRYAVIACFLEQTYRETIVQMFDRIITRMYNRSHDDLDEEIVRRQGSIRGSLSTYRTLLDMFLDYEAVADSELRAAVYGRYTREHLEEEVTWVDQWLKGKNSDVFSLVMSRFSYLRQFAPSLLKHLTLDLDVESTGDRSILEAVDILRQMNAHGKRKVPNGAPVDFLPRRLRRFVIRDGEIDRRAYECAVLTTVRDEIRRGNLWVPGSQRFCRLADFFIPNSEWAVRRESFSRP